jgi:toxin-antitoxin system PIN domain toxin
MTYLPDVNVWIALAAERHTFHRAARHWFGNLQDEKLAFCRLTQLGFLRLLTNKQVRQEEVMRPDEAWEAYRLLRLDRRIGYSAEPYELPEEWQAFTQGRCVRRACGPTRTSAPSPTLLD